MICIVPDGERIIAAEKAISIKISPKQAEYFHKDNSPISIYKLINTLNKQFVLIDINKHKVFIATAIEIITNAIPNIGIIHKVIINNISHVGYLKNSPINSLMFESNLENLLCTEPKSIYAEINNSTDKLKTTNKAISSLKPKNRITKYNFPIKGQIKGYGMSGLSRMQQEDAVRRRIEWEEKLEKIPPILEPAISSIKQQSAIKNDERHQVIRDVLFNSKKLKLKSSSIEETVISFSKQFENICQISKTDSKNKIIATYKTEQYHLIVQNAAGGFFMIKRASQSNAKKQRNNKNSKNKNRKVRQTENGTLSYAFANAKPFKYKSLNP